MFFSKNIEEEKSAKVKESLGPMQDAKPKKYLGFPSMISRSKKQAFSEIKERVWKRLMGWKEKLLSIRGREILIKAMAQAVQHIQWDVSYSQRAYVMTLKE